MFSAHQMDIETIRALREREPSPADHTLERREPSEDDAIVRRVGLLVGVAACAAIILFAWLQVGL